MNNYPPLTGKTSNGHVPCSRLRMWTISPEFWTVEITTPHSSWKIGLCQVTISKYLNTREKCSLSLWSSGYHMDIQVVGLARQRQHPSWGTPLLFYAKNVTLFGITPTTVVPCPTDMISTNHDITIQAMDEIQE